MRPDLVQIHHADYQEDIPFWISLVSDRDPVLEVGCGHGRVTLPLVESGCRVVGVDLDPNALAYLRESLNDPSAQARGRIILTEADILDYRSEESFGAVIVPCNTISTFPPARRIALIQKAHALLREGGLFAASMPNPVLMFAQLAELEGESEPGDPEWESSFTLPGSGFPVEVSSRISPVVGDPTALRWEWIYDQLSPDGGVKREIVSTVHFPAAPDSYVDEMSAAGLRSIVRLGDYDSSEYREDSPYLIVIGEK